MPSVKNPKKGDVYLSSYDISKKLDIPVTTIYGMRNTDKIRRIFNTASFNLDDVREYIKENQSEISLWKQMLHKNDKVADSSIDKKLGC